MVSVTDGEYNGGYKSSLIEWFSVDVEEERQAVSENDLFCDGRLRGYDLGSRDDGLTMRYVRQVVKGMSTSCTIGPKNANIVMPNTPKSNLFKNMLP